VVAEDLGGKAFEGAVPRDQAGQYGTLYYNRYYRYRLCIDSGTERTQTPRWYRPVGTHRESSSHYRHSVR
jgi:hypothetical protein